jgi:hypothetical protein
MKKVLPNLKRSDKNSTALEEETKIMEEQLRMMRI